MLYTSDLYYKIVTRKHTAVQTINWIRNSLWHQMVNKLCKWKTRGSVWRDLPEARKKNRTKFLQFCASNRSAERTHTTKYVYNEYQMRQCHTRGVIYSAKRCCLVRRHRARTHIGMTSQLAVFQTRVKQNLST